MFFACSPTVFLYGQTAYINTPTGIYELTGGIGNCTNVQLVNQCNSPGGIFSLALFKDTIYYNTGAGQLYRFKVGVPGSCQFMTSGAGGNSMTVDKNGILYLAADNQLLRYNPYTNTLTNLGGFPFGSAGDLFYFEDRLLLAGIPEGIYEINISNPALSSLFMNTNGTRFFGLISLPESCNSIKYYGLAPSNGTSVVELDLVNKVVVGTVCNIPSLNVYDAASITETGINTGIIVTSLKKIQPCPPGLTGEVDIKALSTTPADISYTLDNVQTNNTGIFSNLAIGNHTIRIRTSNGCLKDTVFTIAAGLNPILGLIPTNPNNCENNNGTVVVSGNSIYTPLTYTWVNNNLSQQAGNFTNLPGGLHTFRVEDAAGCRKDTSLELAYDPRVFVKNIDIRQSHCGLNNGWIKITTENIATNPLSSINNSAFSPALEYNELLPGTYYLQIKSGAACYFDTTIVIKDIWDTKPQIQIQTTDQFCFVNNGIINLTVTGNDQPYSFQLNGGGFLNQNQFTGLAPGNYLLNVKNRFDCQWDTFSVVVPYPRQPITKEVLSTNPTCRGVTDGDITVNITGVQGPYTFSVNGKKYNNGQKVTGLTEGEYTIEIFNQEQCKVDSLKQLLTTPYESHCNDVHIPNAFTPNDDGKNDVFKPSYSSFIKNITLSIFNRAGRKLYEGKGNVGWDGTYQGVRQASAVYVYILTYIDHFNTPQLQKGHFTLVR
jgi:gliding motility-associated-like protein